MTSLALSFPFIDFLNCVPGISGQWSNWISVDTEGGSGDYDTRSAIAKKKIVSMLDELCYINFRIIILVHQ